YLLSAQGKETIDRIIARVDNQIILKSQLEELYNQMRQKGAIENDQNKQEDQCELLSFLLTNKMLLAQAEQDSISVSEEVFQGQVEARLAGYDRNDPKIQALVEKLKPILYDQLLAQKMERILSREMEITPLEVKEYFKDTPEEDMPYLEDQVEVAHLVLLKNENMALKREFGKNISDEQARSYLENIRRQIIRSEVSFEEACRLYSDDPYSRDNGGFFLNGQGGRRIFLQNLDSYMYFTLDTTQVGNITPPLPYRSNEGKSGFRIIFYKSNIPAHRARVEQDLDWLKVLVLDEKRTQFMNKWFLDNLENYYVELDPNYQYCPFWDKKSK
ncbi:MAG: peptidylprolyl isomerase, partial [Bacteroidota bacterium]